MKITYNKLFTDSDIEQIVLLIERSVGESSRTSAHNDKSDYLKLGIKSINPNVYMHGAWAGDKLVGFCLAYNMSSWFYVDELVVDPDHRDKGIATALLERVCQTAKNYGISHVELAVNVHNHKTQMFVESRGFAHSGTWIWSILELK